VAWTGSPIPQPGRDRPVRGAFGGHGVLISRPSFRLGVSAGSWKASRGRAGPVPVAQTPNLVRALTSYQEGWPVRGGLDAAGPTPIDELDVADGPLVLVIGSEGRGLSRLAAQSCDLLPGSRSRRRPSRSTLAWRPASRYTKSTAASPLHNMTNAFVPRTQVAAAVDAMLTRPRHLVRGLKRWNYSGQSPQTGCG